MKVWTLAVDTKEDSTACFVFATAREAYEMFIEKVGVDLDEANRLLNMEDDPDFCELDEWLHDRAAHLDTYSVDVTELETPAPRVVIVLEGGLVQDILSDQPVEVAVIDYDTDGAQGDDLTQIPQVGEITAEACAGVRGVDVTPSRVAQLWDAITAERFTCKRCGREESECSAEPCVPVQQDRNS